MPQRKWSARQIEVLKAVQDGKVWERYPESEPVYSDMDRGVGSKSPRHSKVTKVVNLLESYSLIKLSGVKAHFHDARQWAITEDGLTTLEEYGIKK